MKDSKFHLGWSLLAGSMGSFLHWACSGHAIYLFAIFPLFLVLAKTQSYLGHLLALFLFNFGFCLVGHEGLISFYQTDFGLPVPLAILVHILVIMAFVAPFSFFVSLSYPVAKLMKLTKVSEFLLVCLMFFLGRNLLPELLPGTISIPLARGESLFKQLYSLLGVEGLELAFLILNSFLAVTILLVWRKKFQKAVLSFCCFCLMLTSLFLLAKNEESAWKTTDRFMKVGYYQPGKVRDSKLSIAEKYAIDGDVIEHLNSLLPQIGQVEMFVLPETYFFSNLDSDTGNVPNLKAVIGYYDSPVLTGGHSFNTVKKRNHNSLFYFDGSGQIQHEYHKYKLMPVGETKPFSQSLPWLAPFMPGKNLYEPGEGPKKAVLQTKDIKIGLAICYEDILQSHFNYLAAENVDFVVTASSDNQFQSEFFAENHMSASIARSMTVRKPLLRVTNTGPSSFSNVLGEIVHKAGYRTEETHIVEIPILSNGRSTFYFKYRHYQIPAAILFLALLFLNKVTIQKIFWPNGLRMRK